MGGGHFSPKAVILGLPTVKHDFFLYDRIFLDPNYLVTYKHFPMLSRPSHFFLHLYLIIIGNELDHPLPIFVCRINELINKSNYRVHPRHQSPFHDLCSKKQNQNTCGFNQVNRSI